MGKLPVSVWATQTGFVFLFFWGDHKGGGEPGKKREVGVLKVHDLKFPNNQ